MPLRLRWSLLRSNHHPRSERHLSAFAGPCHRFTRGFGSDDGFLYSRGFVVAMGREFCDAVTGDPAMAVPYAECEEMCYFFAHLSHDQFGEFPDTGSGISRESGSNLIAWI